MVLHDDGDTVENELRDRTRVLVTVLRTSTLETGPEAVLGVVGVRARGPCSVEIGQRV